MIRLDETYAGRVTAATSGFPNGSVKNETTPGGFDVDFVAETVAYTGSDDGTPVDKDLMNNVIGFMEALLDAADMEADGAIEQVGASQCLDAIATFARAANRLYPTSTGSTTVLGGIPWCSAFTVTLPGTLVNDAVYRFIPHATNPPTGSFSINGKAVFAYALDGGSVHAPRYKMLRPAMIAEVRYNSGLDAFIVMNARETIAIHGHFATAASGLTARHNWAFARVGTGVYRITHNLGVQVDFHGTSTTELVPYHHNAPDLYNIDVGIHDAAGALTDDLTGVYFQLIC